MLDHLPPDERPLAVLMIFLGLFGLGVAVFVLLTAHL